MGGELPLREVLRRWVQRSAGRAQPRTRARRSRLPPRPGAASEATGSSPAGARAFGPLVGVLAGVEGALAGEVYRLRDGENSLGCGPEGCDVLLPGEGIAPLHARVLHCDGVFAVESEEAARARHPTLVNGEAVEFRELSDGDRLRLGETTFVFRTV